MTASSLLSTRDLLLGVPYEYDFHLPVCRPFFFFFFDEPNLNEKDQKHSENRPNEKYI